MKITATLGRLALSCSLCLFSVAAFAEETTGSVTNLPLPRFVSIKAAEANVRRGPSLTHRIDWVFKRRDLPVEITAEFENWRRIRDHEGAGGWVHYTLLSGKRTALILNDLTPIYSRPSDGASAVARLEAGVILHVDSCEIDWCHVDVGGYEGWLPKTEMWGVKPSEVFD
ncbi:SH3 domain-containing protein [Donghicola tyrosinivorans]|uniref:SH3-like domain-containing protein n=1 Tax=Donghicola tyrosinivorans TaxID=1652492 RepID=A0A2T0WC99_9RHOB|nr:SH3 domain-containing protein [Donghicola tyrosinivorans]PRY84305.1 SH3-like domain-containing protein [Donghicola tyrosinivorans]